MIWTASKPHETCRMIFNSVSFMLFMQVSTKGEPVYYIQRKTSSTKMWGQKQGPVSVLGSSSHCCVGGWGGGQGVWCLCLCRIWVVGKITQVNASPLLQKSIDINQLIRLDSSYAQYFKVVLRMSFTIKAFLVFFETMIERNLRVCK